MSQEKYKPHRDFAGVFQLDLERNEIPALMKRKTGDPLLKLSPSRVLYAAGEFPKTSDVPNPNDVVLPPAVSAQRGTIAHLIKLTTDAWRKLRPRNPRGHEAEYRHRVDHDAPRLMPTLPTETLRQVISALTYPGVAMPYTSGKEHEIARQSVYGLIARAIIRFQKQYYPFTASPSLDDTLFPHPNPTVFNRAWDEQRVDQELMQITQNIFRYDEQHSNPIDGLVNKQILLSAGEFKISTFIPGIRAIFTAIVDLARFGYQDPGENHRPHNIITRYDWKTGQPLADELIVVAEMTDYVVNEMLARVPSDVPIKRIGIQVDKALEGINSNTAVVNNYVGFGARSQWEQTMGSENFPLNENREEAAKKRVGFEGLILTMISERPDLLPLFQ